MDEEIKQIKKAMVAEIIEILNLKDKIRKEVQGQDYRMARFYGDQKTAKLQLLEVHLAELQTYYAMNPDQLKPEDYLLDLSKLKNDGNPERI